MFDGTCTWALARKRRGNSFEAACFCWPVGVSGRGRCLTGRALSSTCAVQLTSQQYTAISVLALAVAVGSAVQSVQEQLIEEDLAVTSRLVMLLLVLEAMLSSTLQLLVRAVARYGGALFFPTALG